MYILCRFCTATPDMIRTVLTCFITDNLGWFENHLNTLRTHQHSPNVNVSLYVSRASASTPPEEQRRGSVVMSAPTAMHRTTTDSSSEAETPASPADDNSSRRFDEKALEQGLTYLGSARGGSSSNAGSEKATSAESRSGHHAVREGRPNTATLVRDAVSGTPAHQRVLVAACGPDSLVRVARQTTASLIRGDGPGVELHCEQFGW